MPQIKVGDLRCDCLDVKPISMDWSQGWDEEWRVVQPDPENKEVQEYYGVEDEYDCMERLEQSNYPMMSYFYPLQGIRSSGHRFDADDAQTIIQLPLCLIDHDCLGYGLALTGGGMDLSWQIVEAYILLGYLPPVHFCTGLPKIAGMRLDARKQLILAASRESIRVQVSWANDGLRRLRELRDWLAANR